MDFFKIRVTSLKGSRRFIMPAPINNKDFEVRWESVRLDCLAAAKSISDSFCAKYGAKKFFNVSIEQQRGLQSLVKRRAEEGLVFFQTDKSGRMSVDRVDNFSLKMETHVANADIIEEQGVIDIERILNARAKSLARVLSIGSAWNHQDRVKQALTSTSSKPPPIYGMPKDHKIVTDGQEHPLRPVCGANSGPGYRISNILAQVISPCNNAASGPDIVESTEDLQSCFQVFNSLPAEERKGLIVFSMDATALYPSQCL